MITIDNPKLTENYLQADSIQEMDRIKNITRTILNVKNSID